MRRAETLQRSFAPVTHLLKGHAYEIYDYGFGLFRSFLGGKECWGTTGATLGYLTTMYYAPKDSVALSVFCNARDLRVYETATFEISAQLAIESDYFRKASPRTSVNIVSTGVMTGKIDINTPQRDTSFIITNTGYTADSVYISFYYQNVNISSAISLSAGYTAKEITQRHHVTPVRLKTFRHDLETKTITYLI